MKIALIEISSAPFLAYLPLMLERLGMQPISFPTNQATQNFTDCEGFILVGEDPQQLAGTELTKFLHERNQLAQPILGIGEGAKFLAQTGLVPGLERNQVGVTIKSCGLTSQEPIKLHLTDNYQLNAFTRNLTAKFKLACTSDINLQQFEIPPALRLEMNVQGQLVFIYQDIKVHQETVAGISNKRGNVLAILPTLCNNQATEAILLSMRSYLQANYVTEVNPLNYQPRD